MDDVEYYVRHLDSSVCVLRELEAETSISVLSLNPVTRHAVHELCYGRTIIVT